MESAIRKKLLHRMLLQHHTAEREEGYREAKAEAKRVVQKAKNDKWMTLGERMEKSSTVNQREFWRWVRTSREGDEGTCIRLKDSADEVITEEGGILNRWKEHFEGLLGSATTQNLEE